MYATKAHHQKAISLLQIEVQIQKVKTANGDLEVWASEAGAHVNAWPRVQEQPDVRQAGDCLE